MFSRPRTSGGIPAEEGFNRLGSAIRRSRPELERIIGKLLETDRARRYASAAELRGDLMGSQASSITSVPRPRSSPLLKYGIAAAALITAAGAFFFWQQRGPARVLTDKDTIVPADFLNTTGDPVFDETLRQRRWH